METKITKTLRLIILAMVMTGAAFVPCFAQPHEYEVRVAVLQSAKEFVLSAQGSVKIIEPLTEKVLLSQRNLKKSRVIFRDGGIYIGELFFPYKHVRLLAQHGVTISEDKKSKKYRGTIDIKMVSGEKFLVVNTLPLELYIRGVLYHEVTDRWPMEAMKAQAVAARTYVMYQMLQNRRKDFDVFNNVYSQMYGGQTAERYRTTLAVERTAETVLLFDEKLFPTYYHSNCGGHTEDAGVLWNHDLKPLKGVECPYCSTAPGYRWKRNFRSQDIQEKLIADGIHVGQIKEIKVSERFLSGRVRELEVIDRNNQIIKVSGKRFRDVLGPNLIRSNLYDIQMKGYYFDVIGHGWGHGVGMCQWGAHFMAKERFSFEQILSFYYPGATLAKLK